jgi:galactose mutarotase-like enzyme
VIIPLSTPALQAQISSTGAELVRLQDETGRDLLWSGDPAVWSGRSPLLFPIVGGVKNDRIRVDGVDYPLKRHGFARTSEFEVVEATSSLCQLCLRSSAATRQLYPFVFQLDLTYHADGARLIIIALVTNPGCQPLPVSFGFHPAFRWPLPDDGTKEAHEIRFERAEPAPIRRLKNGLIGREPHPTPVVGNRLSLREDLFLADALIFDRLISQSVIYGVPGQRSIQVQFRNMPHLGIWTKPGADFMCIEPWHGYASPEDFDGDLTEKPGIVLISPGSTETFAMAIAIIGDPIRG